MKINIKAKTILMLVMLMTIAFAGCTEITEQETFTHTGIVVDAVMGITVLTLLFEDDAVLHFRRGDTQGLYLFCRHHFNESIWITYSNYKIFNNESYDGSLEKIIDYGLV